MTSFVFIIQCIHYTTRYALCHAVLITQHILYRTHWQFQQQVIMQCNFSTKIHVANSDPVKYMWLGIFKKLQSKMKIGNRSFICLCLVTNIFLTPRVRHTKAVATVQNCIFIRRSGQRNASPFVSHAMLVMHKLNAYQL